MRKFLFAALVVLISTVSLYGQNRGHKFEVGAGFAPFFLSYVDGGIQFPFKIDAYAEWRYYFGKHVDVGAKLDYKICPMSVYDYMSGVSYDGTQHYGALLVLADYIFRPGKKVRPFIGIGAGPAMLIDNWKRSQVEQEREGQYVAPLGVYDPEYMLVVSPRFGLELFYHLRLSMSVDASLADTRWPVCFNVGWTF